MLNQENNVNLKYWIYQGVAHYNQAQYEKAIESFSAAAELCPDDDYRSSDPQLVESVLAAYHNRLKNYIERREKMDLYQLTLAVQYVKELNLEPTQAMISRCKAMAYMELAQFDNAIKCFAIATNLSPYCANSWYSLSFAKYKKFCTDNYDHLEVNEYYVSLLHQAQSALKVITRAIEIEPKVASFWELKGDIHYTLARFDSEHSDESLKCYEEASALNPSEAILLYKKAHCHYRAYEDEEAKKYFTAAKKRDPNLNLFDKSQIYFPYPIRRIDKITLEKLILNSLPNQKKNVYSNPSVKVLLQSEVLAAVGIFGVDNSIAEMQDEQISTLAPTMVG